MFLCFFVFLDAEFLGTRVVHPRLSNDPPTALSIGVKKFNLNRGTANVSKITLKEGNQVYTICAIGTGFSDRVRGTLFFCLFAVCFYFLIVGFFWFAVFLFLMWTRG